MFIRDRLSPQVKPLLSAVGQGDSGPVGIGGLGTKERLNEVSASRGKACRQRGGCRVDVTSKPSRQNLPTLKSSKPSHVEVVTRWFVGGHFGVGGVRARFRQRRAASVKWSAGRSRRLARAGNTQAEGARMHLGSDSPNVFQRLRPVARSRPRPRRSGPPTKCPGGTARLGRRYATPHRPCGTPFETREGASSPRATACG